MYQYFQMSLCLADVIMGLAGAGCGVFTQFSLLFGYLNICDFIGADAFKASFQNPVEAQVLILRQESVAYLIKAMNFPSEIGSQSILLYDVEERFSGVRGICQVNSICTTFIDALRSQSMNYVPSLSTTVSLLLLSAMAYTRYQVATTSTAQNRVFRLATRYPVCATLLPWMIGALFTLLYFVDIIEVGRDKDWIFYWAIIYTYVNDFHR